MNLKDIAKKIINEDTWGTSQGAASSGGMSPGRTPTAVSPQPTANSVDIVKMYQGFKQEEEKQEETITKKFINNLNKMFLKKVVTIKASKGSVGQPIKKDYVITVSNIDVRYVNTKDKYYIVFKGKEETGNESEYYLEDSIIQVNDAAPSISGTGRTGGMVSPQVMGVTSKRNILPQG